MMDQKFNLTYSVNDGKGKTETFKGTAEFSYNPDTYGNGYSMYISTSAEPFGGQAYDIRYDKRFHKNSMIAYLAEYFSDRYDGENGAWKLIGLRLYEAE